MKQPRSKPELRTVAAADPFLADLSKIDPDRPVPRKMAAFYLEMALSTLDERATRGDPPPRYKRGRSSFYRAGDLVAFNRSLYVAKPKLPTVMHGGRRRGIRHDSFAEFASTAARTDRWPFALIVDRRHPELPPRPVDLMSAIRLPRLPPDPEVALLDVADYGRALQDYSLAQRAGTAADHLRKRKVTMPTSQKVKPRSRS